MKKWLKVKLAKLGRVRMKDNPENTVKEKKKNKRIAIK
jgi:hypothetical protein